MKIFFVTNKKPKSHNSSGSSYHYKESLKTEFEQKYEHLYSGLPIKDRTLQAHVVFIHQLNSGNIPDVDNISKPLVDAFSGKIYFDDNLIIRRTADIMKLQDFDFVSVDATNMPIEVLNDFQNYLDNNEKTILFFEVGEFSSAQIKIGGV